ncbi:MAG: hypothetical protein KAI24_07185, partial [Planctomycetes bacterium]|nr:hypothetical protein [Planctomycetota bacterium]
MANVALIASTVLLLVWWATDHGNANTPRDERDPEAGVDAAVWHASVEPSASGARHTVATVEDDEVRVEARSDGRALADVEIGCRPADANPGWIDQDV